MCKLLLNKLRNPDRKTLTFMIALLIIFSVAYTAENEWRKSGADKFKSYSFTGVERGVGDSFMLIEGAYIAKDLQGVEFYNRRERVRVAVGPDVKITLVLFFLPTMEELEKTGGWFRPKDLKQEKKEIGWNELAELSKNFDLDVVVNAKANIYNKSIFRAESITVNKPIYPF